MIEMIFMSLTSEKVVGKVLRKYIVLNDWLDRVLRRIGNISAMKRRYSARRGVLNLAIYRYDTI